MHAHKLVFDVITKVCEDDDIKVDGQNHLETFGAGAK